MYIIKFTAKNSQQVAVKSPTIRYLRSIGTYPSGRIYFETSDNFYDAHDFKNLKTAENVVNLFGTQDSDDTESYTSIGTEYKLTICEPHITLIDVDDSEYENGKLN
jgi:hypothetical protein